MKYLVTKEVKSETQIFWKLYVRDFLFLVVWAVINLNLKNMVHRYLEVPFVVFAVVVGVTLVLPAGTNPNRRQYQAMGLYLSRPKGTYYYLKEDKHAEQKSEYQKYQRTRTRSHL